MADVKITVRLSQALLADLDALAEEQHGGSRSACIRHLIEHADPNDVPQRLDRDDLRELLEAQARAGSISAVRELRDWLDRDEGDAEVARLNAVAARRR